MLRTQNGEENYFSNFFDLNLYDSLSIISRKDEDFISDELSITFEEKLFYINPTQNKLNKIEIKYNKQNYYNIKQERIENKPLNEAKNKNILGIKMNTNKFKVNILPNVAYRKDAYYKYFKVNLWKYIKNKMNNFKNRCFPFYSRNNFSSPNYRYTGNPKEKDNFIFLSFKIKDIMIFGRDKAKFNRQYNNELIINFIDENENKAKDIKTYKELIKLLNEKLEKAIIHFYNDEKEFNKINHDSKFIYFDKFYKRETGISLLEKYGFLTVLNKYGNMSY